MLKLIFCLLKRVILLLPCLCQGLMALPPDRRIAFLRLFKERLSLVDPEML